MAYVPTEPPLQVWSGGPCGTAELMRRPDIVYDEGNLPYRAPALEMPSVWWECVGVLTVAALLGVLAYIV